MDGQLCGYVLAGTRFLFPVKSHFSFKAISAYLFCNLIPKCIQFGMNLKEA